MKTGATITGNTSTSIFGGGVLVTFGGSFTMDGGTISNNTAIYGGGVLVSFDGEFTMNDGTISGNTVDGVTPAGQDITGGGVLVSFSEFTMNGGTISGNKALGSGGQGGGVGVVGGGYNIGGMLLNGSTSFTMSGGTISTNTANRRGGGVYVNNDDDIQDPTTTSFTMNGGTISGNTALGSDGASGGGGVWVEDDASFEKTGTSVIYGDTDNTHTPESTENTAANSRGHAVMYHPSGPYSYGRNTDLGSGIGITTSNLGSGWGQ
jgi:hypothetical protein